MKNLFYFLTALSFIFIIGCSKNENFQLNQNTNQKNSNIVSFETAKKLSINYLNKTQGKKRKKGLVARNESLVSAKTFNGENELPGVHIFNYEEGNNKRFVIIAGDKRVVPVLAYGDHEFRFDTMPYGVADWLEHQILFIDSIRTTTLTQEPGIKELWDNNMNFNRIIPDSYDDCCPECPNWPQCEYENIGCGADIVCCGEYTVSEYGPLLNTTWGQGCVYNEDCPENTNCDWWLCGHSATGCVATATAQVINYFEYPNTYNYSILQPVYWWNDFGSTGATEIARLMFDVGESLEMDYGCSSGANTYDVNDILEDDFGYSYGGDYDDYTSSEPVKQNIRWGKPVIFRGCEEDNRFIIHWYYSECHAWVCDGYRSVSNDCYGFLWYHMNWGWNGDDNDWYLFNSWTPGTHNFQYGKKRLLNITP